MIIYFKNVALRKTQKRKLLALGFCFIMVWSMDSWASGWIEGSLMLRCWVKECQVPILLKIVLPIFCFNCCLRVLTPSLWNSFEETFLRTLSCKLLLKSEVFGAENCLSLLVIRTTRLCCRCFVRESGTLLK